MASYFNTPLEIWQKYANEACLSTDLKVKEQAQQFFYLFVQTPQIDLLLPLLPCASDLLLFTLSSYLLKHPHAFLRDCDPFFRLTATLTSWPLRELTFLRPGCGPAPQYVTKTIMSALGVLMKGLYQNSETSPRLLKFIEDLPLTYFKIYILKCFIEAVEIIDTDMGYMRFRTMVYSFQDNVIPNICQTLMPFFQNFQEGLRISELSLMQAGLEVSEQRKNPEQPMSLSKQQEMQSELVLMLLKKIVEFNYNITYTEYESQQAIDTCLITFPDKVLQKIINHEFLNSLFYVVEKVCQIKVGEKKNQFLSIVLECLAKIMQSRLGYVAENNKEKFIMASVRGLTHLLQVCQQLQSEILLQGILICNKKLFMSVELTYIQKVIERDPQLRESQLYKIYVRDLSWMVLQIIKKSYVQTENTLLNEALQVTGKMVSSLSYKDPENMQQSSEYLVQLIREVVTSYVGNLCQPRYIFSCTRVVWMTENKQGVGNLFELLKKIASYSYHDLFMVVDYFLEVYSRESEPSLAVLANILFLLSELVDHNFLERNVNLNKAKDSDTALLAQIIKKATNLAQNYSSNRKIYINNKDAHYLDIAVLLFAEAILIDFLTGFQSTTIIKIKQKLYLMMVFGQAYSDILQPQDTHSESTILAYLSIVFHFLATDAISTDADLKMLYALQTIQKVIFKLKWNMRRQIFLKCQLFKQLLTFFDDYFSKCYPVPEIMAKVGKITVTLNFDDVLDQYKFRINKFIGRLPSQDAIAPIFFYLTGVFEGIEPGNICRYFCGRLKRAINLPNFFSAIFKMALENNTDRDYRDVCRFCRLVILNKGLKNASNAPLVYELFNLMLPHLIWFIRTMNGQPQLNLDLLGDAISQLLEMFCGVINGTHVNLFLLDYSSQDSKEDGGNSLSTQYVGEFFKMMILLCRQIKLYPKLQDSALYCFVSINKEILEYIYDTEDGKLAEIYDVLILTEIDLTVQYICQQLNGNKLIEDKLLKALDSLRLFYQYLNRKSNILHKTALLQNLNRFYFLSENYQVDGQGRNQNKNQKLVFYLVSLILTNNKNNLSYTRSISKLIYELNKRFRIYIINTLQKLRVSVDKIAEAQILLQNCQNDPEQNFVQRFKNWLKELTEFK